MSLVDYFTPANEATLNVNDDDLSGSGFTLLPGTNLLLGGGKEGVLYLLDADNLGRKVDRRHADRPEDRRQRRSRHGRPRVLELRERWPARLQLVGRRRPDGAIG